RHAVDDPAVERMLQAWDGDLAPDSAAAAVIATAHEEATVAAVRRLAGDLADVVLGHPLYTAAPHSSFHYRLQGFAIDRIVSASPEWFEDLEARDRLLRAAVARAIERLEGRLGADRHHWHWGDLHQLRFPHMLKDVP